MSERKDNNKQVGSIALCVSIKEDALTKGPGASFNSKIKRRGHQDQKKTCEVLEGGNFTGTLLQLLAMRVAYSWYLYEARLFPLLCSHHYLRPRSHKALTSLLWSSLRATTNPGVQLQAISSSASTAHEAEVQHLTPSQQQCGCRQWQETSSSASITHEDEVQHLTPAVRLQAAKSKGRQRE
eukprot:1160288-Pelagomonas_calceolata.AAC.1